MGSRYKEKKSEPKVVGMLVLHPLKFPTLAGEVSREIHYPTRVKGAGQFCNPALIKY